MNIYISTSNKTDHILPIFCYLFNKYWSDKRQVNILGFGRLSFQLPDNFQYVSMADKQNGGASKWTSYLREYFSSIKDTNFIFGLDDSLIVRPVDTDSLRYAEELAVHNQEIGRLDLTPGMQWASARKGYLKVSKDGSEFRTIECLRSGGTQNLYRISAALSIWNRHFFLSSLKEDRSPWDWETLGSIEAETNAKRVLGIYGYPPVKKTEGLSSSQMPNKINTYHMRQEDKQYIIDNDLVLDKTYEVGDFRHEFVEWSHLHGWEQEVYGE